MNLDEVSQKRLQEALDNVEGKRPALRLTATIAYKNGITQTELAEWFDVERKTIYNWLHRLEATDLEESVSDGARPGRRRKLENEYVEELRGFLHEPPESIGFDATSWTPKLVRRLLATEFDVEYSIPSCRRLMKEAGLEYRRSSRDTAESFEELEEERPHPRSGMWVPT